MQEGPPVGTALSVFSDGFCLARSVQLHRHDPRGGDLHDQLAVGDGQLGLDHLVRIGEPCTLEGGGEGGGEGDGFGVGIEEAVRICSSRFMSSPVG